MCQQNYTNILLTRSIWLCFDGECVRQRRMYCHAVFSFLVFVSFVIAAYIMPMASQTVQQYPRTQQLLFIFLQHIFFSFLVRRYRCCCCCLLLLFYCSIFCAFHIFHLIFVVHFECGIVCWCVRLVLLTLLLLLWFLSLHESRWFLFSTSKNISFFCAEKRKNCENTKHVVSVFNSFFFCYILWIAHCPQAVSQNLLSYRFVVSLIQLFMYPFAMSSMFLLLLALDICYPQTSWPSKTNRKFYSEKKEENYRF